jgi:hypothetical protein
VRPLVGQHRKHERRGPQRRTSLVPSVLLRERLEIERLHGPAQDPPAKQPQQSEKDDDAAP